MRHWLLIVMIVLLPLRGWASAAMGVEMAAHAPQAVSTDQAPAPTPAMAAMDPDCPGHAQAASLADEAADDTSVADDHPCKTCASCQLCNSIAASTADPLSVAPLLPQAAPSPRADNFASAMPAPGFKPPIS